MNDSIDNLLKTTGATLDNREGYIGCQHSLFLTHGGRKEISLPQNNINYFDMKMY
jgi:hypothetical protein